MALRTSALVGLALALFSAPLLAAQAPPAASTQHELEIPAIQPPLPGSELLNSTALTIGDTAITWAEYTDWLTRMRGQLLAGQYAGSFRLEQVAHEKGIVVTDDEVEAAVRAEIDARVNNAFAGKHDAWVRAIGRLGRTEAGYLAQRRIEQRDDMISWRLAALDRVVPESKIVREWERIYGKGGRRYDVRLIKLPFLSPPVPAGMTRYERRQRVEAAREELRLEALDLRAGLLAGDDFAEIARKRSGDSESANFGGVPENGWNDTDWPATVIETLANLAPGDLSQPLYARGGYWIIQIMGIQETPLESVRGELVDLLIEAGPESDEITIAVQAALEGLDASVQPVLWAIPEEGARMRALDEVVMFIDGIPVRRYEYVRWLNHLQGEIMAPRFEEAWLIDRIALEQGIVISPDMLESRVDSEIAADIEEFFKGEREGWLERLESKGRDESMWRREMRLRTLVNMRVEELVRRERTISPEQIRDEYDERYGPNNHYYGVRKLQLDSVFPVNEAIEGDESEVADEPAPSRGRGGRGPATDTGAQGAGEQGDEALDDEWIDVEHPLAALREEGAALRAQVLAGADFATLCRTHSMDPDSAEQGGLIEGGFHPDQWPEYVSSVVLGLEVGEVSEPIEVGSAIYMFQLVESRAVTYEAEAPKLKKELEERRPSDVDIASYKNLVTRAVQTNVLPALFQ